MKAIFDKLLDDTGTTRLLKSSADILCEQLELCIIATLLLSLSIVTYLLFISGYMMFFRTYLGIIILITPIMNMIGLYLMYLSLHVAIQTCIVIKMNKIALHDAYDRLYNKNKTS